MNKKTSSKAAGFGIASVWFGSHCGGGFATGTPRGRCSCP